ncbi:MAG: TetR/AcrR family transcriptional regulator [Aeromicrobium sp.]
MGRKAGRSPDDTRRDILDAARAALVHKGRSASLADIARQAQVTKGGLLYHFGTKEDLFAALADDLLRSFDELLLSMTEPDDHGPGRLCRAYIRASFVPWTPDDLDAVSPIVMAIVVDDERVATIVETFTVDLDARLRDDGLPDDVVELVVAAADGASMQPLWWAGTDQAHRQRLENRLIALTRRG